MGLWPPKKKPLYTPMLATFGGGSSRGFNPGGAGGIEGNVDLKLMNNFQSSGGAYAFAAENTVSANFAASTSNGERLTTAAEFTQTSPGIYKFALGEGTYNYQIRSADGSGNQSSSGIFFEGNLVINSDSYLLVAPGHHGTGSYSGGGATAVMVLGSENTTHANITTNEVAIVAGGGGGGYSNGQTYQFPTTPNTSHNQNRLGLSINNTQSYDGAASIFNNYTPFVHNGQNQYYPEHFVQGFEGGTNPDCGNNERGGFGGGGGSCPGAGGGYPGGLAGANTSNQTGGGGGRSFYSGSTNNLSNFSTTYDANNVSTANRTNANHTNQNNSLMGYFRVVGPN